MKKKIIILIALGSACILGSWMWRPYTSTVYLEEKHAATVAAQSDGSRELLKSTISEERAKSERISDLLMYLGFFSIISAGGVFLFRRKGG